MMAKRKRLSAANPAFVEQTPDAATRGPFSVPVLPPIAGVAGDASATAALEELSRTMAEQRAAGRVIVQLDLEALDLDHLVRDRIVMDETEMHTLMSSLKARGQQTPIEVMDIGGGRYGLISGWRRCQALRRLAADTGEARFGTVLALLRRPQDAPDAYQAMVEENEIRVGLSHFERARIVLKSVEQGVFETEKKALQTLFASASRSKRSKIGSFIAVVRHLDGALLFPASLGERLGLALSKAIEADSDLGGMIAAHLRAHPAEDITTEQAGLERVLSAHKKALSPPSETQTKKHTVPESDEGTALSACAPSGREVAPGVRLLSHPNGDLTLTGAGLTSDFRASLRTWLKTLG
jgi:ParB family chromosome partitioning protein